MARQQLEVVAEVQLLTVLVPLVVLEGAVTVNMHQPLHKTEQQTQVVEQVLSIVLVA
jgi:hypothetical protein